MLYGWRAKIGVITPANSTAIATTANLIIFPPFLLRLAWTLALPIFHPSPFTFHLSPFTFHLQITFIFGRSWISTRPTALPSPSTTGRSSIRRFSNTFTISAA